MEAKRPHSPFRLALIVPLLANQLSSLGSQQTALQLALDPLGSAFQVHSLAAPNYALRRVRTEHGSKWLSMGFWAKPALDSSPAPATQGPGLGSLLGINGSQPIPVGTRVPIWPWLRRATTALLLKWNAFFRFQEDVASHTVSPRPRMHPHCWSP